MSVERITKFNAIIGNPPLTLSSTPEAIWANLELQAKLALEEAQETYDAALSRDIQEYLDGSVDQWYVREYKDDLLKALGVDVAGGKHEVCYNNDQKYTTSFALAVDSAAALDATGASVSVHETEYQGTIYYTVKRDDGKVQKLLSHVRPDLAKCVPKEVVDHLSIAPAKKELTDLWKGRYTAYSLAFNALPPEAQEVLAKLITEAGVGEDLLKIGSQVNSELESSDGLDLMKLLARTAVELVKEAK